MLERKTTISNNVIHLLQTAKAPLTVSQIIQKLKKKELSPNKTTIYRIIEKLLQKKIITEIPVRNGSNFYEFRHGDHYHHHHHFICNQCETVFCLKKCHLESHNINLSKLLPNKDFTIQSHDFNLYGICERCSQKN